VLARSGDLKQARRWIDIAGNASPTNERIAEERAVIARLGRNKAKQVAASGLQRFPVSAILQLEQLRYGSKNDAVWRHLGADAARVLTAANTYIRLNDYRDAVDLLSHRYLAVSPGESEPGSVLPQQNPLVAYYRGYCRQMLGQSAGNDYQAASRMDVRFIYPNMSETERVLRTAIAVNAEDANAHWLLGALLFAHGQEQPALVEWDAARRVNPGIPALDASLGRELLALGKTQEAAQVLEEGTKADARNPAVYLSLDQALTQLSRPPSERAETLQRFPDRAEMPSELVFLLARDLADAGEFDKASALFRNRYFERSEQGADVREVYLEVKLKAAKAAADQGNCRDAAAEVAVATKPVADVPFSSENLSDVVQASKPLRLLRSSIERTCAASLGR
jgi:tetratricopeptide (TPR) repeat protein